MCIIIAKPKGVKLPTKKKLERCFKNNPDGAGIAYAEDSKIRVIKGFMTFKEFWQYLQVLGKIQNLTKTNMILHFRLATHGEVLPQNCHPFPVSNNEEDLLTTDILSDMAIAHNGVIRWCGHNKDLSDTQIFIRDIASELKEYLFTNAMSELISQATNSKFAVICSDKIRLIGTFFADNGCYYSNTSYKYTIYNSILYSKGKFKSYYPLDEEYDY